MTDDSSESTRRRATTTTAYRRGDLLFENFPTVEPKMQECIRLARSAAASEFTVLITGESGTGKNLLAQAIHNASSRREGPFVAVNTSALSEHLLESELFGHEKGAFTGAERQRHGQFELSRGGTLVLDEIGDMSLAAQPKILHAVEYRQFHRVGGEQALTTDARIIAVTNCNLEELVQAKKFRLDLLYRLQEISIDIPPLRERKSDIPAMVENMLITIAEREQVPPKSVADAAMGVMMEHSWPGNLRELRNVVRRSWVLCTGTTIGPEHLGLKPMAHPLDGGGGPAGGAAEAEAEAEARLAELSLAEAEDLHIRRVLKHTGGNKRQTAKILDISRSTLDRKLQVYDIDV